MTGPAGFSPVQGGVRLGDYGSGAGRRRRAVGYADAGGHTDAPAAQWHRLVHLGQDVLGEHDHAGYARRGLGEHDELVTAHPRGQRAVAERDPSDPLGHPDKKLVSGVVPVPVVDGLESVEVQVAQADPGAASALDGRG